MNLADAIRQAATGGKATPSPTPRAVAEPQAPEEGVLLMKESTDEPTARPQLASEQQLYVGDTLPEAPSPAVLNGNVVRLELFLNAEQMSAMLRSVMAGQHSVMTLREAAAYLRVNSHALEKMAQEGDVPAFTIEGRWRFPKPALDEWLAVRSFRPQEESNVA